MKINNITQVKLRKMCVECQAFYDASILLWDDFNKKDEDYQKVFPYVVNSSFACELALKAILIKTNVKYGRTHYIYSLLSKVPNNFIDIVVEFLKESYYPNTEKEAILNGIKAMSDLFYKVRYISDFNVVLDFTFIKRLTEVLYFFEQKLCGQYEIIKSCRILDENEAKEVDKRLDNVLGQQIEEAQNDAKKQ
jgi:hydrogenase maturation factor